MSEAAADAPSHLLFRPDTFFLKPWRGWGVIRDGFGRPQLRYTALGHGRGASRSAAVEQVFTFENGVVHRAEWEIVSDDDRRYFARDLVSGVEARGELVDDDFRWAFRSRGPTPFGRRTVRTEALYTLASSTAAFSFAKVSWMGLRLATYTTFYEQL
jgi:hypothetical protein